LLLLLPEEEEPPLQQRPRPPSFLFLSFLPSTAANTTEGNTFEKQTQSHCQIGIKEKSQFKSEDY
ncbi:MAG: hypothetical protein AAF383_27045, partial [Cyanobacteria bacterium P01_A01_bin.83]